MDNREALLIKSNENIYLESKSIYYNINPRYNFYSFINKNTPDTASIYSFIINYVNIINNRYIIIENINSSYKIYSSNPIYTDYVIKKLCSLINDKIYKVTIKINKNDFYFKIDYNYSFNNIIAYTLPNNIVYDVLVIYNKISSKQFKLSFNQFIQFSTDVNSKGEYVSYYEL